MTTKKAVYPARFWPALIIFSLVGQVAWVVENMYFNVFIYKMFRADPSAISAMVSASAIAATVTAAAAAFFFTSTRFTSLFFHYFTQIPQKRQAFPCLPLRILGTKNKGFILRSQQAFRFIFSFSVCGEPRPVQSAQPAKPAPAQPPAPDN